MAIELNHVPIHYFELFFWIKFDELVIIDM